MEPGATRSTLFGAYIEHLHPQILLDKTDHVRKYLIGVFLGVADHGYPQRAALPELAVIHFGHRDFEATVDPPL